METLKQAKADLDAAGIACGAIASCKPLAPWARAAQCGLAGAGAGSGSMP